MATKKPAARSGPVAISTLQAKVNRLAKTHIKAEDNLRHAELNLMRAREKNRARR